MKISFDLNISLDKDKKSENTNVAATDSVPRESRVNQEAAPKAIAANPEENTQPKTAEPVKVAEDTASPTQSDESKAENTETKAPSRLDKAVNVVKEGKELYDNGKEVLELVSSIKTRGTIAGACMGLSVLLIIITPIFCYSWPEYQLEKRAQEAAAEAVDNAMNGLENGKNLAAEKKDELAPKINEAKEELGGTLDSAKAQAANTLDSAKAQAADTLDSAKAQAADTLDSAKAQAADTLDSAEKALDSKLDSAKKWLQSDDNEQDTDSAKDNK